MKTVPLSDLFEVRYGHKFDLNKMERTTSSEGVAFVNRTARNNGVVAIVERLSDREPAPAGALTIALGGSILATFLQVRPFYTGQNVAIAIPKAPMTEAQLLYYAAAIRENAFRYSTCGREANRTFKSIAVPALDTLPAWVEKVQTNVFGGKDAPAVAGGAPTLHPTRWRAFEYQQLFEIERGRGPRKKDLNGTGKTPFITSTDRNNGFTNMTQTAPVHPGNVLTVNRNGSVAEAFYQEAPFCSTEDVHVFKPKFKMTPAIGLFLATLIRREKYRFSYGRKWGIERMKKSVIKLPTDANGQPDWAYMERYIKTLPFSSQVEVAEPLAPSQAAAD